MANQSTYFKIRKAIRQFTPILLLVNLLFATNAFGQEEAENNFNFPELKGPYMGQKPPGMVAEPFAPGIISREGWEVEGVFAPGMKEFYYTLDRSEYTSPSDSSFRPTVIGFRQENNIWTKYIEFPRNGETAFSPDGKRMHLAEGYKDRVGDGWSERKDLGAMFENEDWGIMRLTASEKGTYVFDDYKSGDVIRISTIKDGKRQAPVEMPPIVNSGEWTAHPFIAPDESYLIWDSEREGGFGDSDLYISFKQNDGSWGPAINMGDKVNSDKWDAYASVTSDGKYILFNRRIDDGSNNDDLDVDIYWVDAKVIEELRYESNFPSLQDRYFGEEPPGLTPKLFAPETVSPEGLFEGGSYSPDMKEFYFSRKNGKYKERTFFVIRYENNQWGQESETEIRWPNFSEDGNMMYGGKEYRERTENGWSEPKSQGEFLKHQAHGISLSSNGTYYFGYYNKEDKGKGSIRYSRLINGKHEDPVEMGPEINTGVDIAHPYIAPDESYLMWDVEREDGNGGSDIYISFRNKDDNWLPAINMGDKINTSMQESSPRITPDGKYLFFSRGEWQVKEDGTSNWVGHPYWVDAKIIENLRPIE